MEDEADLIIGLFIYEIRVVTREMMIEGEARVVGRNIHSFSTFIKFVIQISYSVIVLSAHSLPNLPTIQCSFYVSYFAKTQNYPEHSYTKHCNDGVSGQMMILEMVLTISVARRTMDGLMEWKGASTEMVHDCKNKRLIPGICLDQGGRWRWMELMLLTTKKEHKIEGKSFSI